MLPQLLLIFGSKDARLRHAWREIQKPLVKKKIVLARSEPRPDLLERQPGDFRRRLAWIAGILRYRDRPI